MKTKLTRREFIAASTLASAAAAANAQTPSDSPFPIAPNPSTGAWARWLDGQPPTLASGVTWGMPWPRGKQSARARFDLRNAVGARIPLQTWPLAHWPDGSLKWSAHAMLGSEALGAGPFEVVPAATNAPKESLVCGDDEVSITIDTGAMRCRIPKRGRYAIASIHRDEREALRNAELILVRQDRAPSDLDATLRQESFASELESATIEQNGPIRAVVKLTGKHANAARKWLPFTLRCYFFAGSDSLRIVHTIVFDGDESRDFIRGVGLRFELPMHDAMHDRHVRFAGDGAGVFAEAVRGLTGLRRDPGQAAREAQLAGRKVPAINARVEERLDLVPAFGDWTLLQSSADAFSIRKRTDARHGWLDADRGQRSAGLAYIGGASGGVSCGIRNFWQSHPGQIDIRNAATDVSQATLWVWAPDAQPMDLRFYHDGLGQDTYEEQLAGLEITYEDYEPGFATALGVARTSEMMLWMHDATPSRERFAQMAHALQSPATIVVTPQTLHEAGVFGRTFAPPSSTSARAQTIERRLGWLFDFYLAERDRRSWYGFWNYGDVMHTYDADRHTWRYDVGGYAWDNSELSTDIWLWLYFLRTGRADVFRFAEAMTRHTGEVDVHHLGKFAPLGSRHNVMHWGCSAKQLRISTALNRRYYFYLTGDERSGELLREQVEAARTLRTIEPGRKLADASTRERSDPDGHRAWLGFGTDWGSIAGAWLTEWERTQDPNMRSRLLASMRTIGAQPRGFFTLSAWMNLDSGAFEIADHDRVGVSHLSAAFGLPEVCAELIELLPEKSFERAWLQYCELYNASPEAQRKALGEPLSGLNLEQGHARLTAYAAYRKRDARLARRAWEEFARGNAGFPDSLEFSTQSVAPPRVLNPVIEAPWLSTNSAAQWGLAAIECLAFAPASED